MRSVVIYHQESYHQGHSFLINQWDNKEGVIDISTRAVILSFGPSCIGFVIEVGIDYLNLLAFVMLVNFLKTLDEGGVNNINFEVLLNFNNHGLKGENVDRHNFFLLLLPGEKISWRRVDSIFISLYWGRSAPCFGHIPWGLKGGRGLIHWSFNRLRMGFTSWSMLGLGWRLGLR